MLDWKDVKEHTPEVPLMGFGWSSHLLVYSASEECWFEAVYHFRTGEYYTIDHVSLEDYNITHFCEEVPTPNNNG